MKFEEQFPSLKGKSGIRLGENEGFTSFTYEPEKCDLKSRYYSEKKIKEYCLDKQKVIDAVEIALPDVVVGGDRVPSERTMQIIKAAKTFIKEELGL